MTDTAFVRPAMASGETSRSAVSWSAIIAGAVAAIAISILLVILGVGLGLTSVSPWSNMGASATAVGVGAIVWLIVTQWLSAGLGGYLAGRLRTKWVSVHTHEVFFRDTAHGFLAWALGTVVTIGLLSSAIGSMVSGATSAATTVLSGAAQGAAQGATQSAGSLSNPAAYFTDMLFRSDTPATNANPQDVRGESAHIFTTALGSGEMAAADRTRLAQLVASQTGLSQADAEKRVDDVMAQAKAAAAKVQQAADDARKAAATFAIFLFLSLIIGAFIASAAAAYGGSERDEHESLYAGETRVITGVPR